MNGATTISSDEYQDALREGFTPADEDAGDLIPEGWSAVITNLGIYLRRPGGLCPVNVLRGGDLETAPAWLADEIRRLDEWIAASAGERPSAPRVEVVREVVIKALGIFAA